MNEAEKERLIKKDIESIENRVRHAFNQGYEMGMKERQNTCVDAVSREAVEKITWEEPTFTDALNVLAEVRDKVRALPSVIPQQRAGRWIDSHIPESTLRECSECGFTCGAYSFNYCPDCGAKMEVRG